MKAIILAAGSSYKRLNSDAQDPRCLEKVNGVTALDYIKNTLNNNWMEIDSVEDILYTNKVFI